MSRGRRVRPREPLNKMDKVLIILGVFLLAFVAVMVVTYWVKGSIPDTLVQCVLGTGGFEALFMAGIKIAKVISGGKPEEGDNDGLAD